MLPLVLTFILLAIALSIVFWSIRNGITPMPSTPKAKKNILELLSQNLNGNILELGSGWGTLAFSIAKKLPQCQVTAYENSPVPFLFSKLRLFIQPRKNLSIQFQNFFHADLSHAQCIVCYLYPGAMQKLNTKFKKELKPGTWILSNTFALTGRSPIQSKTINDLYNTKIYLYQIK